jgi:hypothetical protein
MQLATDYSHLLTAQIEQAKRVKARYPSTPTFVYLPIVDAQPYYDSEAPLFADRDRYADFFYLNGSGALYPPTTHHKCMSKDEPKCLCTQWNFFNATANSYFLDKVVDSLLVADSNESAPSFDGVSRLQVNKVTHLDTFTNLCLPLRLLGSNPPGLLRRSHGFHSRQ